MKIKRIVRNNIILSVTLLMISISACDNSSDNISKPSVDTAGEMCLDALNKLDMVRGTGRVIYSVLKNNESDKIWNIEVKFGYKLIDFSGLGNDGRTHQSYIDCTFDSETRSVTRTRFREF